MDNEFIAIRLSKSHKEYVPSARYLMWCDDKWYETGYTPIYAFSINEIETIKKQLVNNYIYKAAFIYKDGKEIIWDYFHKPTKKVEQPKNSGFTFTITM